MNNRTADARSGASVIPYLFHRASRVISGGLGSLCTRLKLQLWGHHVGKLLRVEGHQTWYFDRNSRLTIGNDVRIRDGVRFYICQDGSVTIEDDCELKGNVTLEVTGHLTLKRHTLLAEGTLIGCRGKIDIGPDVMIAAHTTIVDHEHGTALNGVPMRRQPLAQLKPIVIESDVWIGSHATILEGVHIGQGSIIGASSVVKTNIPPYSVAVGAPAKVKGPRRDNTGGTVLNGEKLDPLDPSTI